MATRTHLRPEDLRPELLSVDELVPFPGNPRHGDQELIERSLLIHGQYRPILLAQDGVILAGNHTYRAQLALRDSTPAAAFERAGIPPPREWAVALVHVDDELAQERWREHWSTMAVTRLPIESTTDQAAEILAMDNAAADAGRQDSELLTALLARISDGSGSLLAAGYPDSKLDELRAAMAPPAAPSEFPAVGADVEREYECPNCHYIWSGQPKPSTKPVEERR